MLKRRLMDIKEFWLLLNKTNKTPFFYLKGVIEFLTAILQLCYVVHTMS